MSRMGKFLYFGYGSNLLASRIRINNPSAVRKGAGKLINYRLDFNSYSNRWKGAVATIVPSPGSIVWGSIWELNKEDLQSLDEQEGVHQNMYFPFEVEVATIEGNLVKCRTYQQTSLPEDWCEFDSLPFERRPSEMYKNCILEGAIETGLPSDYIEKLKSIPCIRVSAKIDLLHPN